MRVWIMLSPLNKWLGPAWFRRFLASLVPDPNFQRVKKITEIMDARSRGIFKDKKQALLSGDEELKQQFGQGMDIMSILCMSLLI